jgi:hypothetical protein
MLEAVKLRFVCGGKLKLIGMEEFNKSLTLPSNTSIGDPRPPAKMLPSVKITKRNAFTLSGGSKSKLFISEEMPGVAELKNESIETAGLVPIKPPALALMDTRIVIPVFQTGLAQLGTYAMNTSVLAFSNLLYDPNCNSPFLMPSMFMLVRFLKSKTRLPEIEFIGCLFGSFWTSLFLICLLSISFTASENPITISKKMPNIKTRQPHFDLDFCRLKSSVFRNQSFPAPCSIQSPTKTMIPPTEANTGQPQDDEDSKMVERIIY